MNPFNIGERVYISPTHEFGHVTNWRRHGRRWMPAEYEVLTDADQTFWLPESVLEHGTPLEVEHFKPFLATDNYGEEITNGSNG